MTDICGNSGKGAKYLRLHAVCLGGKKSTMADNCTCSRWWANIWPKVQVMSHVFELAFELTWSRASFVGPLDYPA